MASSSRVGREHKGIDEQRTACSADDFPHFRTRSNMAKALHLKDSPLCRVAVSTSVQISSADHVKTVLPTRKPSETHERFIFTKHRS